MIHFFYKMNTWMREWGTTYPYIMKRITFTTETIDNIHEKVSTILPNYEYKTNTRTTEPGFFMKLHRDDYHMDYYQFKKGVRDDSIWIPIYQEKRPVLTAIWYHSTQGIDFAGGNLRFFDGEMIRPTKNIVVLFDSNDIHEVTLQVNLKNSTNKRIVSIIKYYKN